MGLVGVDAISRNSPLQRRIRTSRPIAQTIAKSRGDCLGVMVVGNNVGRDEYQEFGFTASVVVGPEYLAKQWNVLEEWYAAITGAVVLLNQTAEQHRAAILERQACINLASFDDRGACSAYFGTVTYLLAYVQVHPVARVNGRFDGQNNTGLAVLHRLQHPTSACGRGGLYRGDSGDF